MRKTLVISIITLLSAISSLNAQTFKALGKVQKAIISVNTYDKNGDLLNSGTGFYVGKDGEAIADYTIFKNAYKATVIDMSGKQADVDCILGANDVYSLVRFKVNTKGNAVLKMSTGKAETGSLVFVVPFSTEKKKTCRSTTVESASPVLEKYSYYTLATDVDSSKTGCPLFNENGEIMGVLQPSANGKGYALDINYKNELVIKAIASSSTTMALNSINIPKGLPETLEESLVYTYIKSRSAGNTEYLDIMNRFVATYPDNAEGYLRRCTPLMDLTKFDEADADLQKYYSLSADKALAEYNIAQAIYNKLTYQPKPEYAKWSYDLSLDHINKSIATYETKKDTNKLSDAKVMKAKILAAKKDYDGAVAVYDDLLATTQGLACAPIYYAKSMVCESRGDSTKYLITLMDSAMAKFTDPLPKEASDYVLRRGRLKAAAGMTRDAVKDYNEYCYLVNNQVSDVFYYDRCQIEMKGHLYQQAYEDITTAISMKPNNLDYQIEKAGMCLRFNYLDESISICNNVLSVIPNDTDALRILGYAQLQKGDKENARKSIQKAIDLGDELSKEIMKKFFTAQ